jgi:AcrR family transcriptional regulator
MSPGRAVIADAANPPRRKRGRPPIENLEEQRRAQIIASAVTVFAERGFEATTMSDIARHAGVGQGTIYRYVASKRELLDLVFDYSVEQVIGVIRPVVFAEKPLAGPADLFDRFDAALSALTEAVDRQPELLSLVVVEIGAIDEELKLRALGMEATVVRMTASLFEEAQDAGFLRPGADPEVFGLLATKLLLPAGLREVMGQRDPATRDRYRAALVDFARHAFFTEQTDK